MKFTLVFTILLVVLGAVLVNAQDGCICTADYTPVCGKDGRTYSNSCRMGCEGIQLAYKGECGKNI